MCVCVSVAYFPLARTYFTSSSFTGSLVTHDLAVNCTWDTEEDCMGSDRLPIITELNENIKDDESEDEEKKGPLSSNISMLTGKHVRHSFYLLTLIPL